MSGMAANGIANCGDTVNEPHKTFDTILVLDFGYTRVATRPRLHTWAALHWLTLHTGRSIPI